MRKTKRLISIILLICTLASLMSVAVFAVGMPFKDVNSSAWYYDAVSYVYEKSIMNGVSSTEFSPESNVTRAQMCQLLYNLEGRPKTSGGSFTDVSKSEWYYDAVIWAASKQIVNGMGDGTFAPNSSITREQMVTLLYRYAQHKNYSIDGIVSLDDFSDIEQISDWADTAMKWAVGEAYISGTTSTTLSPNGTATRAQIATIFMRFCKKTEAYLEFKAKDIKDFKGYSIINLDESVETNYAVLTKSSVEVNNTGTTNQLISADEEKGIYSFSNIDTEIKNLQPGDIFYYTHDGDYELFKVGTIEITDSNATLTSAEAEFSDYFEYVDIDLSVDLNDNSRATSLLQLYDEQDKSSVSKPLDGKIGIERSIEFGTDNVKGKGKLKQTFNLKVFWDKSSIIWQVEEICFSVKSESSVTVTVKKASQGRATLIGKKYWYPMSRLVLALI